MRLIHLPTFWTIILDIVVWFVIHVAVVFYAVQIPAQRFNPNSSLYRLRRWGKSPAFYQKFFKIKRWKRHIPDGAKFFKRRGFPKKTLKNSSGPYLYAFLLETCRAELTHWIIILFAPLFFLWNRYWVGWFMILYALIENIPIILVQRYNRARFLLIIERKGRKI